MFSVVGIYPVRRGWDYNQGHTWSLWPGKKNSRISVPGDSQELRRVSSRIRSRPAEILDCVQPAPVASASVSPAGTVCRRTVSVYQ